MSDAKADTTDNNLLTELRQLAFLKNRLQRTRAAWDAVCTAGSAADELDVALDYAVGHDLMNEDVANRCRLQHHARLEHRSWVNPVDDLEMIFIPPGPFRFGKRKRLAESSGFSLARHPVTNRQFKRFLEETGYTPPEAHASEQLFLEHWVDGEVPTALLEHPVVYVSFVDAAHYCRWAGLDLPTEWLWEKAARGPEGRKHPWGSATPSPTLVNIDAESTAKVGSYPRTRTVYGCEDMIGNVSEWCRTGGITSERSAAAEAYGRLPTAPPSTNLSDQPKQWRPVRGSCFLRVGKKRMVSYHRRNLSWMGRNQWVGFRPALFPRMW